ncbi:UNVERIFIED_CONTAM: LINE-1 reverse transcriptase [Sesamum latifolium]|uniref:LINE-1 reverse transcriptase n=1 Tax=Sesamum latifolium TaxID=2727402 RepID=A0AAW2XP99_9LAMI
MRMKIPIVHPNTSQTKMDYLQNSLSSLTHITPQTHTSHPSSNGGGTEEDKADETKTITDRIKREFNILEFLALAHRVIDEGDVNAMGALAELKQKWETTIGPLSVAQKPPPLQYSAWRSLVSSVPHGRLLIAAAPTTHANPNPKGDSHMAPSLENPSKMVEDARVVINRAPKPLEASSSSTHKHEPLTPHHGVAAAPPMLNPNNKAADVRVDEHRAPLPHKAGSSLAHDSSAAHTHLNDSAPPVATMPTLFIGNVPLRIHAPPTQPEGRFADGFNNSSRKTLRFIQPEKHNGEVIVRPTLDMIQMGSRRWEATAVGYFLGRKPPFHQVSAYVRSIWHSVKDVIATVNGFFFIQFTNCTAMEEVIDGGPWLFQGQPIVLQHWVPGMALRKHGHTQVPIWVKLCHLPVELWTSDGLSTIASGIGRPLYLDAITKAGTRLNFARVCVMVDFNSTLPKHLVVMFSGEDGGEQPFRVDIEYEWKPPTRTHEEPIPVAEPTVVPTKEVDTDIADIEEHEPSPKPTAPSHKATPVTVLHDPSSQLECPRSQPPRPSNGGPGNHIWLAWDDSEAKDFLNTVQRLLSLDRRSTLLLMLEHTIARLILMKATKLELRGHRRIQFLNIDYLRPWARHIITNEEADNLIRPVLRSDVKAIVFDIAEDKASGPDGYSAAFYKAAWPVIGDELTHVVQDFFNTGKLLKQINATLLTLIPIVVAPTTVGDYRPISCCNVLYKIITKIIVQRMQPIMKKIISPSQNAFVPGQRISSNVLLAQELFAGMITWIEECISTTAFSISLNGGLHDFFMGARGLRQGDPMSPYLFVLAMEVLQLLLLQSVDQSEFFQFHWKCKEVNLLSLCFADDLLLFCKADERSMMLFREGLETFAQWSGLEANIHKSHLIVSKAALAIKPRLLTLLGFQEGVLPVIYLGLPLISSRLTATVVDLCLQRWMRGCRDGGGIIKIIEARMRKFLWQGGIDSGMAKVAWKDVCRPLEEGDKGIRALESLNRGLMCRHLWDVVQKNDTSIWVSWILTYRLKRSTVWTANPNSGSWCWRKIVRLRIPLLNNIRCEIGPNSEFKAWPEILDIEHREITDLLPQVEHMDAIRWTEGSKDSDANLADITSILMADAESSRRPQEQGAENVEDSDSNPETTEPTVTQPDISNTKPASGPWFTFDDVLVIKRRERLHTFSAWIDLQLTREGATLSKVLKEFASRFTGSRLPLQANVREVLHAQWPQ